MGYYALTLIGSTNLGPIIAGFINDGLGYEWVFYIITILCACVFVFLVLFMEETNYARASPQGQPHVIVDTSQSEGVIEEKGGLQQTYSRASADLPSSSKTFLQKMALLDKPRPNQLWTIFKQQIRFTTFPVVLYCGYSYGLSLVWAVVLSSTASEILSR